MEYMTIIAMILFGIAYGCLRERAGRRALALKALATSMAVTAGLYGAVQSQDTAGWLIVAGLVLCMIADVVLEIRMVGGIGIFGAGHLCLIAAFWLMSPPTPGTLLLFLAIYVAAIGMVRHEIAGLGGLKVPAFLYMAVLGFMVSMAVTSGWHIGGSEGMLLAAGACLFLASDCMIAWRTVKDIRQNAYGAILLILYYAAVYLIGSASWI